MICVQISLSLILGTFIVMAPNAQHQIHISSTQWIPLKIQLIIQFTHLHGIHIMILVTPVTLLKCRQTVVSTSLAAQRSCCIAVYRFCYAASVTT